MGSRVEKSTPSVRWKRDNQLPISISAYKDALHHVRMMGLFGKKIDLIECAMEITIDEHERNESSLLYKGTVEV